MLLVTFQIFLIVSGNLSFLNYLTIIPFLACFDDTFCFDIFCRDAIVSARGTCRSGIAAVAHQQRGCCRDYRSSWPVSAYRRCSISFPDRQLMNYSFDPLDLVNTYGAFGTVGPRTRRNYFRGNGGPPDHRRHEMEGIRIQSQAGRSESPSAVRRAVSTADRLANLVRGHGLAGAITRGRSISSGNFCTTTPARSRCSQTILFQTHRRITFARGFIVIGSRRLGEKAWWKREPVGEWLPAFRQTINSSAACLREWAG